MVPWFNPIALDLGFVVIRWYALAYTLGILTGWYMMRYYARHYALRISAAQIDDLIVWITAGIIIGGRLGYVLFYKPSYFMQHPLEILYLWQGGMSFHGGLLGVVAAIVFFAKKYQLPLLTLGDLVCSVVPVGLFLGRIANFINGELYGRVTSVPWAMVFPHSDGQLRHPSQLYQACLEGLLLYLLVSWVVWQTRLAKPGRVAGTFLVGYASARMVGELFREPDSFLGFIISGVTMGQLLSVPLLPAGLYLLWRRPHGRA